MYLAGAGRGIDDPDPFNAEGQVFADLFHILDGRVVGGKDLDAQVRRQVHNTARPGVWPFGDDTYIGDAKMVRSGLYPLFRHREQPEAAAKDPQRLDQKTLYCGVFPGWHGSFDNSPLHKLRIVLEAHVKVLFGADQFRDGHNSFYIWNIIR